MPLAFDKRGEVGASTAKVLRFSPQSLNIKQFTINMHSNKVLRKHDMHDMQHTSRHNMHDVQTIGDTWIT